MSAGSGAGPLTEILRSAPGREAASWGEEFCSGLQAIVQADLASLNGMTPDLTLAWAVDSPAGTCGGETARALARLSSTHPGMRWGRRNPGNPVRLAEVEPWSSFRRTELFADLYRPLGLRYEIVVVLEAAPGPVAVAVQRTGTDFGDRAEELLVLLRPLLAQASSTLWGQYEASARDLHPRAGSAVFRLTPREREVLSLLVEGARDGEIADRFGISPATAKKHVEHILAKLGVRTRAAAVATGARHGLISLG